MAVTRWAAWTAARSSPSSPTTVASRPQRRRPRPGAAQLDLDPGVVCGQHGWWQECAELGLPGYPPYGPDSANLDLILRQRPSDPVSGSAPLRASLCEIERIYVN